MDSRRFSYSGANWYDGGSFRGEVEDNPRYSVCDPNYVYNYIFEDKDIPKAYKDISKAYAEDNYPEYNQHPFPPLPFTQTDANSYHDIYPKSSYQSTSANQYPTSSFPSFRETVYPTSSFPSFPQNEFNGADSSCQPNSANQYPSNSSVPSFPVTRETEISVANNDNMGSNAGESDTEWDDVDEFGLGDYSDASQSSKGSTSSQVSALKPLKGLLSFSKITSSIARKGSGRTIKFGENSGKKVEIFPGKMYSINVDGYYRKPRKGKKRSRAKGGYGVIIKCVGGEHIIAKTGSASVGISEYFHTMEGVKQGLELLLRYPKIKHIYIACNSDWVSFNVNQCLESNYLGKCDLHCDLPSYNFQQFCVNCFENDVPDEALEYSDSTFENLLKLMEDIVTLGWHYYNQNRLATRVSKRQNSPADFLAKMQLGEMEIQPHKFPPGLRDIIEATGEFLCYPRK